MHIFNGQITLVSRKQKQFREKTENIYNYVYVYLFGASCLKASTDNETGTKNYFKFRQVSKNKNKSIVLYLNVKVINNPTTETANGFSQLH